MEARDRALLAIRSLHSILKLGTEWNSEEMGTLARGIGLSIGTIEVDLLRVVFARFPDLDDLEKSDT